MSYLLLDKTLSNHTNLIKSDLYEDKFIVPNKINDIYQYILDTIRKHPKIFYKYGIYSADIINNEILNRKLIKLIYMPLIYGKSVYTISKDIASYDNNRNFLPNMDIAKALIDFFKVEFNGIVSRCRLGFIII